LGFLLLLTHQLFFRLQIKIQKNLTNPTNPGSDLAGIRDDLTQIIWTRIKQIHQIFSDFFSLTISYSCACKSKSKKIRQIQRIPVQTTPPVQNQNICPISTTFSKYIFHNTLII